MQAEHNPGASVFGPEEALQKATPFIRELVEEQGGTIDGMRMSALSVSDYCTVLKLSGAEWACAVKAFNPSNPDARTLLRREHKVLEQFNSWPLTPNLIASQDDALLLFTEFVEGPTLDQVVNDENAVGIAQRIGSWLSLFSRDLPKVQESSDWATYLANYDDMFSDEELSQQRALLSSIKINHKSLAKNDPVLSNFLRDEVGNLVGLDFAETELKPLGWDLLLTARFMGRQFPNYRDEICEALVRGWRGDIDGNSPEDFTQLVKFFAVTTANRLPKFPFGPVQRYTENYAALAKIDDSLPEAKHVFRVFRFDAELAPNEPDRVDQLRKNITQFAAEAIALTSSENEGASEPDISSPSKTLTTACALCRGGCCRRGMETDAYLSAKAMQTLVQQRPDAGPAEIADYYIERVPEMHVSGSCYFHGENGCTLPRSARSKTCNTYLCRFGEIIENSELSMTQTPGPTLIVGLSKGRASEAVIMEDDKTTSVDPELLERGLSSLRTNVFFSKDKN